MTRILVEDRFPVGPESPDVYAGRELMNRVSGRVVDHEAYRFHSEIRAMECDVAPDELSAANFFPAYRGGTDRV